MREVLRIEDFKDKYSGRVFLLGNGPSLTPEVVNKLKGERSFAVNEIAKIYPHTDWRPDFVSYFDRNAKYIMPAFQEALDEGAIGFCLETFEHDLQGKFVLIKTWPGGDIKYTDANLTKGVHCYGSSLHSVAQICIWMGFTELYFVGCDLGFDKQQHHFYHNPHGWYRTAEQRELRHKRVVHSHELTKEWCEMMGVTVKNATNGGELEVYERIDLDDLLHSPA